MLEWIEQRIVPESTTTKPETTEPDRTHQMPMVIRIKLCESDVVMNT